MTNSSSDLVKHGANKRPAIQRKNADFLERFSEGLFSLVVELRVDEKSDPIRVWLSCSPEARANPICHELVLQAIDNEDHAENSFDLIAGMAVENFDGIRKGRRGKGVFTSLITDRVMQVSPPFWWLTGKTAVERSTYRSQMLQNAVNGTSDVPSDLYRHSVGADLLAKLRGMAWSIHPGGFFVDPLDSGFKVIEALAGPV